MRNDDGMNFNTTYRQLYRKRDRACGVQKYPVSIFQYVIAGFLCALNLLDNGFLFPALPREIKIFDVAGEGFGLSIKEQIDVVFEHRDEITQFFPGLSERIWIAPQFEKGTVAKLRQVLLCRGQADRLSDFEVLLSVFAQSSSRIPEWE